MQVVSYGSNFDVLPTGLYQIKFDNNCLEEYTDIDERNLIHCEYLNFRLAQISSINTKYLGRVKVVILYNSNI